MTTSRACRVVPRVLLVAALVVPTGCIRHHAPLGGIGVGLARPLGGDEGELGVSWGMAPDVSGTAPLLLTEAGDTTNPVLEGSQVRMPHPLWLDVGFSAPVGEGADVGVSLSRGLHARFELVRGSRLSVVASPAVFYNGIAGSFLPGSNDRTRLWNFNLTWLVNAGPFPLPPEPDEPSGSLDLFAGVGLNHYRMRLETDGRSVHHTDEPLSVVGGVSLALDGYRFALEGAGAWIRQRGQPSELVPVLRGYLAVPLRVRERTRR